jgi:hypothetical protein
MVDICTTIPATYNSYALDVNFGGFGVANVMPGIFNIANISTIKELKYHASVSHNTTFTTEALRILARADGLELVTWIKPAELKAPKDHYIAIVLPARSGRLRRGYILNF